MGQNLAPPAPQPIRAISFWSSLHLESWTRRAGARGAAQAVRVWPVVSFVYHGHTGEQGLMTHSRAGRRLVFITDDPVPVRKLNRGDRGPGGASTTVRVAGPVCAVIHRLCLPPEARRAILLTTLDTTPQRHLSRGAVDNRPSSQNTSFHLRLVDVSLARGSRSRGARLTSPKSATAASDTISATPLRVLS